MGVAPRDWDAILARLEMKEELALEKLNLQLLSRREPPSEKEFGDLVADVRLLHRRLEEERRHLERAAQQLEELEGDIEADNRRTAMREEACREREAEVSKRDSSSRARDRDLNTRKEQLRVRESRLQAREGRMHDLEREARQDVRHLLALMEDLLPLAERAFLTPGTRRRAANDAKGKLEAVRRRSARA